MQQASLASRQYDVAGASLTLHQDLAASRALRPLLDEDAAADGVDWPQPDWKGAEDSAGLAQVGLVAWQCGFLLADYLLRRPPFRQWQDVRLLDLGAGTGVVGILLALAGADVVLADLPHITQLTSLNVQANCDPSRHRATVVDYAWGDDPPPSELQQPPPDIITGADLVYDPNQYGALVAALECLAAPHTLVFLAIKLRGKEEDAFEKRLADAGFAVAEVPAAQLGPDYREEAGTYRLLRACKLG